MNEDKQRRPMTRAAYREQEQQHHQVNFWRLIADRPYVSVACFVLLVVALLAHWWLFLVVLLIAMAGGIAYILHSKDPNQALSLEFHMSGSAKLNMLKAIQLGASCIMFLMAYMRRIVSIDFQRAGASDSFQIVQGLLQNNGNGYAQRGSQALGQLNGLLGNGLFSQYRYATSSAQFMADPNGRWLMVWTFLLMLLPAVCVLAQFFREPYARNATLIAAILSVLLFAITPSFIRREVVAFGASHNIPEATVSQAFSVGSGTYVAILCAIIVLVIAVYRLVKQDNL
ncbi:MAG: cytochrome C5 [Lactobacillus sp.]